jgi:cyclase
MTIDGCVSLHGAHGEFPMGLRQAGVGTYAWWQPNGGWGETNAGLVVGDGAALLIDTLWDAHLCQGLLNAVTPVLAGTPLTFAVNTHRDGDHWWGNVALPSSTQIWSSAAALQEMAHEPPPKALARLVALSRAGAILPGRTGRLSRYVDDMFSPFDFSSLTPRRPDQTFTGQHTLDVGGRTVRLYHLGPAHTAGDVVVHVPDAGVVYSGDLLFSGCTPIAWAGPTAQWRAALDVLLSLDAAVYVPGHGPQAGRREIELLRDYWLWLESSADPHLRNGVGPVETARRLVRSREFAPWREWGQPERLILNVRARHRELNGLGAAGHGPLARAQMFSEVAELAALIG